MQKRSYRPGSATLVTAAFIGPGTVTVCTLAGVEFGFELLWALLISILATIIIQNTAARMSYQAEMGLVSIVKEVIPNPFFKFISIALILSAIFVGNIAYEAGNISGAVLGFEQYTTLPALPMGERLVKTTPIVICLIVALMIWKGQLSLIKNMLIGVVGLMSVSFILAAVATAPAMGDLLRGMFVPQMQEAALVRTLSLVGTTIVPYNLFLHAALVKDSKSKGVDLAYLQKDTYVSIALGGIISLCIVISAASLQGSSVQNAADMGQALIPILGDFAPYLIGLGLFAAGLSSAITAPLAAAFVLGESFSWDEKSDQAKLKYTAIAVLLIGMIFASTGYKPVEIIQFAQVANGLLLPFIGIFIVGLLWSKNQLGITKPKVFEGILLLTIMLFFFFLGMKSLGLIH